MIPVQTFGVQVTLQKMVHRQDGLAAHQTGRGRIDLTPFLGMSGSIITQKDLVEPAGGFSITIADKVAPEVQDSLYGLIEPMDLIEIRATRAPQNYAGRQYPIIMRGWVSAVRRVERIAQDGSPQRVVVIMGQDSGKLWLIAQILWELLQVTDQPFLNTFHMQAVTGLSVAQLPVGEFMSQLVTQVMNPKLQDLAAFSSNAIAPFGVDVSVKHGTVSPSMASQFDSQPVWSLAAAFADRPWNELFIEDREDAPYLVFRPTPFKDINGQFIDPDASDPGSFAVDASVVTSLDLAHTDARVANFFWVPPGTSTLDSDAVVSKALLINGQPLDFDYPNNNPVLYGVRKMEVNTSLLPDNVADYTSDISGSDYNFWFSQRSQLLEKQNRDNAVWEEGTISLQGNENLRAGQYMKFTRGQMRSEHYAVGVAHQIFPMRGWTSSISLVRGTGFLVRNQSTQPAMWLEGRPGPYSP